jgi:hypothetical protein
MLELRPTCEHCNKPLPPHSTEAMICSFECTFCKNCVDDILSNVCPNCGGGFARPHRPSQSSAISQCHPASTTVKHRPIDPQAHAQFAVSIKDIPSEKRQFCE